MSTSTRLLQMATVGCGNLLLSGIRRRLYHASGKYVAATLWHSKQTDAALQE
jgi:hypothetical protein